MDEISKYLQDIDDDSSYAQINNIGIEIDDDDIREEFFRRAYKLMEDDKEEDEIEKHEGLDWWECQICGNRFEWEEHKQPLRCDVNQGGCGKDINNTNFEALTGIYTYFNTTSGTKPTFVPRKLAEDIMDEMDFLTTIDTEEIYYYDDGHYQRHGEQKIREIGQDKLKDESRRNRLKETVEYIKNTTYTDREELYNNKYIVMENGVYDLEDDKFKEHDPGIKSLIKVPIDYDPDAECPMIKDFIGDVVHDDEIPVIQEIIGYCLSKRQFLEKSFMFLGGGANGKSTLLNMIITFLGEENVSGVQLQQLTSNRFVTADIFGKLANVFNDLPGKKLYGTGIFKSLTGGDKNIRAERKNRDEFYFENTATLIFSANELPETSDMSDGFFRRWVIIDFPYRFPEGEEDTDPNILDKIITDEELSGLFNWALEGLRRLKQNGQFSYSRSREENKNRWIMEQEPLKRFADEKVIAETGKYVERHDMFNSFKNYCEENGVVAKPDDYGIFVRKLNSEVHETELGKKTIDNDQKPVFKHVKVKGESFDYDTESSTSDDRPNLDNFEADQENEEDINKFGDTFNGEIKRTIERLDDGDGASRMDIIEEVDDEYTEEEINNAINMMKDKGTIYEYGIDLFRLSV